MSDRTTHATRVSNSNQVSKMNAAAERYIASDRSDPFTRNRVYSHMLSGIASPMRASRCCIEKYNRDDHGKVITPAMGEIDAYYDCEQYAEQRSYESGNGDAVNYTVPAFRNIVRP
jgi:hypothetical protein